MKKTYLIVLLTLVASVTLVSQNLVNNGTLENWDNASTPTSWDVFDNIAQESTTVYEGTYSAAQTSDDASQKFRQDVYNIIGGQEYVISYYYLDNSTSARTRIWSYWMEDGTYLDDNAEELRPSTYSEENPDWQHYSVTLTAPLNANEFRFDVRTYKQDGTYGGTIYFDDFSVSGDVVVYPEPSNYPTMFTATANGLSIDLSWDESVGDQLPTGYLVLGEKTSKALFDVPVDGTPVDNDLDWSDNKVSVNVSYGSGGYTFDGLETNGSYSFTIYPFTNSGSNIDYKTDGTAPTADATTSNISVINSETFDMDLGSWTGYNVTGDQMWEWADFGNPPGCAKASGYDGSPIENEDWLISPELDLEGYTNITLGFDHARNFASNDGLFVMISTDYDGSSDPNTATWENLTASFTFPDQGSWTFIDAGIKDISSFASDATYIAFVYNSTTSDASTWEVDNIEVLGVLGTGISSNIESIVSVYPNPASDVLNIELEENSSVRLISLTGKVVMVSELVTGKNTLDVQQLPKGMYIVETKTKSGIISARKVSVK